MARTASCQQDLTHRGAPGRRVGAGCRGAWPPLKRGMWHIVADVTQQYAIASTSKPNSLRQPEISDQSTSHGAQLSSMFRATIGQMLFINYLIYLFIAPPNLYEW